MKAVFTFSADIKAARPTALDSERDCWLSLLAIRQHSGKWKRCNHANGGYTTAFYALKPIDKTKEEEIQTWSPGEYC